MEPGVERPGCGAVGRRAGQGGEDLSADYHEVAGEPKQLWKTDSDHTGGYDAAPKEYERRVVRTGLLRTGAYRITMAIVFGFQCLVDGWLTRLDRLRFVT